MLAKDIKVNGVKNPIVIDKKTGNVLDGQHRAFVSKNLGIKEIPVIYVDSSRFTLKDVQNLSNNFDKTKSQLTDIWNKANKVEDATGVADPKIKEIVDGLKEQLIQ